jgi:hypothetical protein
METIEFSQVFNSFLSSKMTRRRGRRIMEHHPKDKQAIMYTMSF